MKCHLSASQYSRNFEKQTSDSGCFRSAAQSLRFIFFLGGCLGGDEAEPAGGKIGNGSRSSKEIRGSEDETPANKFFHVHRGGSAHAARIPGIISTRRRSLLGEKEKKREGTRLATTSLVSPRSFTARCYTQFKLLSDQGANIHHSELALAVFTPGLLYKRQIKNTSFHFIPSPCIFSGLYNYFFYSARPPQPPCPAANPATLRPIPMSRERQR